MHAIHTHSPFLMPSRGFHVVTFHTEGPPADRGLSLGRQAEAWRTAFEPEATVHVFTARSVRGLFLRDGRSGADAVREYPPVSGHPNTGLNAVGWGAFKPFVLLYVLEARARRGDTLLYVDSNVWKHFQLGYFASLALETSTWLLAHFGADHGDVVMPRERASLRFRHVCSVRALDAAAARCGGRRLDNLTSAVANRIAVRAGARSRRTLSRWLDATLRIDEMAPGPMAAGAMWHTPEQCAFGLEDACAHGAVPIYFRWFFTKRHAQFTHNFSQPAPALPTYGTGSLPARIDASSRGGATFAALSELLALRTGASNASARSLDGCLVMPKGHRCKTHAAVYRLVEPSDGAPAVFVLECTVPRRSWHSWRSWHSHSCRLPRAARSILLPAPR